MAAERPGHAGHAEQLCPTHASEHAELLCFPPAATGSAVPEAGGTVVFGRIWKYKTNNAHLKKIKDTKKKTSIVQVECTQEAMQVVVLTQHKYDPQNVVRNLSTKSGVSAS